MRHNIDLEKCYTRNNIPIEQGIRKTVIRVPVIWIHRIVLVIGVIVGSAIGSLLFAFIIVGLPRTVG